MRIGHGYDVHRLVSGRALILGGVTIPYEKGLDGHSDADVLVHAVMDALLGAAAMGDIGKLFPDNDDRYLGADSMELLREVSRRLEGAGYRLGNLDATIIAQRPKLAPHIEQMRRNIAGALHTGLGNISVKATTEERLGFTGSGEGIAAAFASTPFSDAAALGAAAIEGGTMTEFERECDNAVNRYMTGAHLKSFGPEQVVGYLTAEEGNTMAVRMVLTGLLAGIDPERLKERLRKSYV